MLYNKDWAYKLNPVADVLFRGADLLEKRGHVKHIRLDYDGRMCFLGALDVAQGYPAMVAHKDTDLTMEASEAVGRYLGLGRGVIDFRSPMAIWNNQDERTGQEVIDAMRNTAIQLVKENA